MNLKEKVTEILCERLAVDKKEVVLEADLSKDLGADSLDEVEVIMAIEEEFGIDIPDEDAEKIKKVEDILKYLESNVRRSFPEE